MQRHQQLADYLKNHPDAVGKVVDYDAQSDKLLLFDFTSANTVLTAASIADTVKFSEWINTQLARHHCRYGIGGYMEHRTLYARSALFDTNGIEPRRLHLGTDIWGPAGTPVYAPLAGRVHSLGNHNSFGDYGATIILEHQLAGLPMFSLYGHLNAGSLQGLHAGLPVAKNQQIACFGEPHENGSWPPHLHFQLMFDMQGYAGDYPGVCRYSEKEAYRQNIPDPELLLQYSGATIM